jgi:hypothetical protein
MKITVKNNEKKLKKALDKIITICYTTEAVKKGRIRGRVER